MLHDATVEAGLVVPDGEPVESIDWVDMDGDGVEDMLLSVERGILAFRNLGQARFERMQLTPLTRVEDAAAPRTSPTATPSASRSPVMPDPNSDSTTANPVSGSGTKTSRRRALGSKSPQVVAGPAGTQEMQSGLPCAAELMDALVGGCIQASTVPTLGMLMPLSSDFFVNA
ncbi:MAG TPA: hypothetical protein ENJ09_11170, partial [Planctomycetes bacterium]|nr:hypothetical protein [Planctomycetota bacterium]